MLVVAEAQRQQRGDLFEGSKVWVLFVWSACAQTPTESHRFYDAPCPDCGELKDTGNARLNGGLGALVDVPAILRGLARKPTVHA